MTTETNTNRIPRSVYGMDTQQPDTRGGYYYVTAIDGGSYAILAGPYDDHQTALEFWSFGTARFDESQGNGPI